MEMNYIVLQENKLKVQVTPPRTYINIINFINLY